MRSFTLVELMIVVAIIGILASIAIPAMAEFQLRAKRAELPVNVDGLASAMHVRFHDQGDPSLDCTDAPTGTVGKQKRDFAGPSAECMIDTYGWQPDGAVYGAYGAYTESVAPRAWGAGGPCSTGGGWGAHGWADVEGEGDPGFDDGEQWGANGQFLTATLCSDEVVMIP